MVKVVEGNKIPLYKQLAMRLMQQIRTGDYQAGSPLPPVRIISQEYGVSVTVVQHALRELERRGLVVAQHGKQVTVVTAEGADRAALLFGLVHPYAEGMAFGRDVLHFAANAFAKRHNLLITVSSDGIAKRERERIEHLVSNGVRGLIVWPVPGDDNAEFLDEIARKVPIVLVDRLVAGSALPAVIHDTARAGREVCLHFFIRCQKKRLLMVMDDLDISPYHDMLGGIQEEAASIGRSDDLTVIKLPISELVRQFNASDFSNADKVTEHLDRILTEGGYDAMFCYQEDMLDYVVVEPGLLSRHPGLLIGATRSADVNIRSRRYVEANPAIWHIDHVAAISSAADRLQQLVLSKRPLHGRITIPLACRHTIS